MANEFFDDSGAFAATEEDFYEDSLSELQARRHELERTGRAAADIIVDLQDQGPLYKYVLSRKAGAIEAIEELVNAEPGDVPTIASAQARIREYLTATNWIDASLEAAKAATDEINGEQDHGEETNSEY